MFLKHIICTVKPENKSAFSEAQKLWSKSKEANGFIAQIGGWNSNNPNEAVIIAFWKDKLSLDQFMTELHDDIFLENEQQKTYDSIVVSHFNCHDLKNEKSKLKKEIAQINRLKTINGKTNIPLKVNTRNHTLELVFYQLRKKDVDLVDAWKVF